MKKLRLYKKFLTVSYKTTACGLFMALGQLLVLAPVAQLRWVGSWVNGDSRHAFMTAGVFITFAACVALGIVSRDHDVSSEQTAHSDDGAGTA